MAIRQLDMRFGGYLDLRFTWDDLTQPSYKRQLREELNEHVRAFLARGGRIQQIPPEATAYAINYHTSQMPIKLKDGVGDPDPRSTCRCITHGNGYTSMQEDLP